MKSFKFLISSLLIMILIMGCGGGTGPIAPPDTPDDGRVSGYGLLYPDLIARWETSSFPLKIWVDAPPPETGPYAPIMVAAVIEGLQLWNNIIDGIPVAFVSVQTEAEADVIIIWEQMRISGYTLATQYAERIRIRKAVLNENHRDPEALRLITGHELGHVLGLDLSNTPGDLMHKFVNPASTTVTQRDRDMINWLYSQENFFPIRSE